MTRYYAAPDGADEPTIWERTDGDPAVVVRRAELPGPHTDLLWRVLTGVLCADDEIRQRVEGKISDAYYDARNSGRTMTDAAVNASHAALAALRGEQ